MADQAEVLRNINASYHESFGWIEESADNMITSDTIELMCNLIIIFIAAFADENTEKKTAF